jgi:hypothetical protein
MAVRSLAGPDALDFWLGDWDCVWDGGRGENHVTRELDGHVIVERFASLEPERWTGTSWSVHDERRGWRQTWVDSTGNYWAFHGDARPEGFAFAVSDLEDGREVAKRMVFSGITADAFAWRWERSEDGGETWQELWSIAYRRRGSPEARNR